jgi:hypothetical protein
MNDAKYIGMDVHQATISVAVRDSRGNLVMGDSRNESGYDPSVYARAARQFVGDL